MSSSKLQPALLGGAFIGVLSALPIVSVGNVCCCLWIVAGGALTAWVLQQRQEHPVTPADGAAAGFLAGIFGAFIYVLVAAILVPVLLPLREAGFDRLLDDVPEVSPEARELFEMARGPVVGIAVGFVLQLGSGMVFSTVGGLLGALLFRRGSPVPPPPPTPPLAAPRPEPPPPAPSEAGER